MEEKYTNNGYLDKQRTGNSTYICVKAPRKIIFEYYAIQASTNWN